MIDNFGRSIDYLRISVTDLCNLRCRYCMPEEGVPKQSHESIMTFEEIVSAAAAAAATGIRKIRITGGEPLVRRGIVSLCKEISSIEGIDELCMTTNGTLLVKYASQLKEAGVSRLNISLDTLVPEKFRYITRLGNLEDALEGIDAAYDEGFDSIKINNVLTGGFNDDEIEEFVNMTRDRNIEVRFIELMPIGGGIDFDPDKFISCEHVLERVPQLESMGFSDGVANLYKLPEAEGRVGLIRPISHKFCDRCNKIRLTSDGMLKPCLHSDREIPLKGKSFSEMEALIRTAILEKPQVSCTLDSENPSMAGRDMNMIGG
ncbi:MAG: GTP 3',8-cyclase MoaA [Firmicutes bacterium]|nr:GTP 3',8-cyclase MoaA [Bacillota bacterium]